MADFSGDGLPDIVWQDTQTGDVLYYEVKNQQWTGKSGIISQGVSPVWRVAGLR